jgi:hypothetical protein
LREAERFAGECQVGILPNPAADLQTPGEFFEDDRRLRI